MIFEPLIRHPLPSTDLLTYIFSDPKHDPNIPAYVDVHDPSRSISHTQARGIIRQLIAGLRAWGVQKGDCVAIHSFNDIYYSMLVLAIIGAGGIFTGTNPAYTPLELAHHFKTAQVRFVVAEPEILPAVQTAIKESRIPDRNVRAFNPLEQPVPNGLRGWKEFFDAGEADWVSFDDEKVCAETTAARLFSSGTTGLPKAVTITHRNMIAQHEVVFEVNPKPYRVTRVVATPVFHAAAAPAVHFSTLKGGHTTYLMRRFDLAEFLRAVETHQVTDLALVPPIALAVIMNPMSRQRPYLKSLKSAACGAAPLDKSAQARFRSLMAEGAPFTQVWGMTETSCVATLLTYPEHDEGSVGRLVANLEAKLVNDKNENISAYNVRGELCVRGPTVTPGYFNNPSANAESFDSDGWFHTGDIAYCDGQTRKWYIVDRKKELIKVRGFQVAPPELEAVLLSHPLIVDAAVIGLRGVVADSELPRAYVVKRPGAEGEKLTKEQVRDYLEERLAKYKALTGGVRFVDAIPKNASGKILKKVLREESQKEIARGVKL
ncbi:putative AMP-binding enzyme [Aspergillus steynii IBT 23096]|uniref:Putative AMP-binding enzyme n=1 Tax=Aspergillus steynii IBT 23096 TaxID=1392250 RepID=A0A2I2FU27_9EURO|nr:putative AMP-binding enzyme [Aspergillus steynii IBT 23096]PLB44148.1 putative AMP-binding enzyme [Aspergillus steynii IBT 23096]